MRRSRKWFFTLAAVLLFLICGEFLPEEPLKSKAVVVGFGIDLTEEKELFVHMQILTGSGKKEESGSDTRVISAKGSTLGDAAYEISRTTGLAVSLTHCNVVLLGESLVKSPYAYAALNYLICNAYLSDNACLLACEGSSYDLLSSPVAFGGNASVYIREIVGMYDSFGDVTGKTLRKFMVDYHRIGQTNWLPYLTKKKVDPKIPSSSSESAPEEKSFLFEMNNVIILNGNRFVGVWDDKGAFSINCLLNKFSKGQLHTEGDHGESIDWFFLKNDCKLSYSKPDKTVKAELTLEGTIKEIVDLESGAYADRIEITDEEKKRCEKKVRDTILAFFNETKSLGADVFGFREGFYAHCRYKEDELSLSDVDLELTVHVKET